MKNYGVTRILTVCKLENMNEETFLTPSSSYIQAALWGKKNLPKTGEELVDNLYADYSWVYFALKQAGKLDEYGLPAVLNKDVLDDMSERLAYQFEPITNRDDAERAEDPTPEASTK